METKSKIFSEAILLHSKFPKKVKLILDNDRRLTQSERKILRGFLLIRDNKNYESLEIAEEISIQGEPFVESMRQYLIASCLNNLGQYTRALIHFKLAEQALPQGESSHLEYIILNNIHNVFLNLHKKNKAKEILSKMLKVEHLSQENKRRLNKVILNFYCLQQDHKKATASFNSLMTEVKDHEGHDFVALQMCFFHYGVTFENYDICYKALSELKPLKKFSSLQNYNYMKILLDFLVKNKPVYICESDFTHHQQLLYELKAIRALETNGLKDFRTTWSWLNQRSPETFTSEFEFKGEKSLFSECFDRLKSKTKELPTEIVSDKKSSILEAIEKMLMQYEIITKEQIFYSLYGREPETKAEMQLIVTYLSRLKRQKNLTIISKRGGYSLAA